MIESANPDAVRAWDGPDGAYWARHHVLFDSAMRGYHERFMAATALDAGHRVLDVGCGNGETSCAAADVAGDVLGVDLSTLMLEQARARASSLGLTNIRFEQADAQVAPFDPGGFDAVISRTGTMFFRDPHAAFGNIARALVPGGRLTMLVWQSARRNEWFSGVAAALGLDVPDPPSGVPGPFSMADPEFVSNLLTGTGFTAVRCASITAPMFFGATVASATEFIGGLGFVAGALRAMDVEAATRARDRLHCDIIARHGVAGVEYDSAAWLVTAAVPASEERARSGASPEPPQSGDTAEKRTL